MAVQTVIKKRRDTAANWISVNPVLAAGEEGFETDSGLSKVGNGTDAWVDLDYNSIAVVKEKVKNSTGSTIAKGAVVYISGANGDNALISLADADTELTSSKTLGFVSAAIADGAIGTVTTNGILKGVNTGSATAGQSVWLSSTAGGFVFNTPPAKPAHSVYLGVVVRAHSVNGAILVKVQNGYELEELHNVSITNPATGDVLTYDSVSGLWINSEGGTGSASITVSDTAPVDPQADSMWWNSAEGTAYIRYDNTWVPLSPGIAGPAGPTGVIVSDTAPTNTAQLWADPNAAGSYVVPANGSKGQVLTKITDSSYDTGWTTPQGSGNAIINGAFDIWQRGTSVAISADATYVAPDRYKSVWAAGGGTGTWSQQTFTPGTAPVAGYEGTFFSRQSVTSGGASTEVGLAQWIENVRTFAGQTVTLSFWAKADSARTLSLKIQQRFGTGGSGSIGDFYTQAITTSWARYSLTITLPSIAGKTVASDSSLAVLITLAAGQASGSVVLDIWGVQLEAGSSATPFKRNAPSIQGELAACQRYYYRSAPGTAYAMHAYGHAISTTQAICWLYLPVPMRSTSMAFDYSANSTLSLSDEVNATIALSAAPAASAGSELSTERVGIKLTVASGLTQFRPYVFDNNNNAAGYFGVSAEL
jgi:hypothetical protein